MKCVSFTEILEFRIETTDWQEVEHFQLKLFEFTGNKF